MSRANPGLVFCSLPGFASDDPRADVSAFEGIIGAATANFRTAGGKDERPVYTAIPNASVYAAFQSARGSGDGSLREGAHWAGAEDRGALCSTACSSPSAALA